MILYREKLSRWESSTFLRFFFSFFAKVSRFASFFPRKNWSMTNLELLCIFTIICTKNKLPIYFSSCFLGPSFGIQCTLSISNTRWTKRIVRDREKFELECSRYRDRERVHCISREKITENAKTWMFIHAICFLDKS